MREVRIRSPCHWQAACSDYTPSAVSNEVKEEAVVENPAGPNGQHRERSAPEQAAPEQAAPELSASEEGSPEQGEAAVVGEESESKPSEEAVEGATSPELRVEALEAEVARVRDQLLRTAADFDNFRKRTRRELEDAERRGREDFLKDLLPVFDNLERAAEHAKTASDVKALSDGIELVIKHFGDTLGKLGVERVPGVGERFDPAVHEAIQHLETSEFAPGVVAAEVQAGYRMGERLVRPAMVVVAKAPSN